MNDAYIREDLIPLYVEHICANPTGPFPARSGMLNAIRAVWDRVRDEGLPYASLREHRSTWEAAIAEVGES